MKKTGEILKKAREEKGLSLHEIGLSLKISSKVLKAIEDGDDPNLPAKTFIRGFVQSYANFLHLNLEEVLKVFHEEMGSTKPKPYIRVVENETPVEAGDSNISISTSTEQATVTPIRKSSSKAKNDSLKSLHEKKNTKTIVITVIGFALIGLIIFTKKMIDKYSKEAEVPTAEVAQTIKGATPVVPETLPMQTSGDMAAAADTLTNLTGNIDGASIPASTATTTGTSSTSKSTATAAATTTSSAEAPAETPATSPAATQPAKISDQPSATATKPVIANTAGTAASTEAAQKPVVKPPETNKPVELIVEALDAVEIEYSAPNGNPQKIKLSAEQVHTFKSKSGLKINFSNGGAVNLIHNGKEIGIPGDLGKPVKLSY